ncbi:MAG: hypothetical protein JWO82_2623, partial [Akkermansiaceae bacterium]|nr:hypothetical protein [Akkermansiaceae bacterium]
MRSPTRLLLVALAASLPSCERHSTAQNDAEWWRLEGDREASAQRLTLLQTRFERATAVQLEVDSIFASTGNLAQAKRTLESQRAQVAADIAALDDQVQDARHQWAAAKRSATVGRSFTSLTSRAGRTYENVTVTRVTDAGIEFRHQNGSGRFSALEMTPQQMDDFGIESADAIAAHQQERADAHAYNRAVDKAVADNKADRDQSDSNSSSRGSNSNRGGGNSGGGGNDSGRSTASNSGSSRGGSPALASNGGSRSRLDEPP